MDRTALTPVTRRTRSAVARTALGALVAAALLAGCSSQSGDSNPDSQTTQPPLPSTSSS